MANYATLKSEIQQNIKQNGENEITGNLLQQQLLAMINLLGAGFQYVGVANQSTNPGTPDYRALYLLPTGSYPNFDGVTIGAMEIGVATYDSAWHITKISLSQLEKSIFNTEIYFSGRNYIKFENTEDGTNRLFIWPTAFGAQLNVFGKGLVLLHRVNSWADLLTEIGATASTSPKGIANCLLIPPQQQLVFDTITNLFALKEFANSDITDIVLVRNVGGRCVYVNQGLLNPADVASGILVDNHLTFYFSVRNYLLIDESADGTNRLYFKPTVETVPFNVYATDLGELLYRANTWAAFATAVGRELVPSPYSDKTNCILLNQFESLVFNITNNSIAIRANGYVLDDDVVLLQNIAGRCVYVNSGLYNAVDVEGSAIEAEELPTYWQSYMATKVGVINGKSNTIGVNGDNFVFITDIHNESNFGNSPKLIKYILENTSVRNVVCGGDLLSNATSVQDALNKLQSLRNKYDFTDRFFPTRGNHDVVINANVSITFGDFYSIYLRPLESVITLEKEPYYYRDNLSQKIRYIFVDGADVSNSISAAQKTWLQSRITELTAGWTVVIFTHTYWNATQAGATPTVSTFGNSLTSAIDEIVGSINATIAAIIVGHCHCDRNVQMASGYQIIATTCDTAGAIPEYYDPVTPTRTNGTTSEQVFDVFTIDTSNRKIYITRIGGNGSDRELNY